MENLNRISQLKNFAAQHIGNNRFDLVAINTDASTRKYYRLTLDDGKTMIVLDDEKCCC